ncbi:ABC transporter permease [Capnocytophaga canimorsus]|uniref:ABC transporter permease n=1 Tax=Capnocytophaga canimorsus TaxID=28188 RepID=UPI001BB41353|nr:ABC transporter permease [Capnocytophaga canimorsus]
MVQYALKKSFQMLLTLLGVVSVVFFLFNIMPGDPARMMLDQNENSQQLLQIKKKYGFDQSLPVQYWLYLNDLSPISLHSKQGSDYTYFENKYTGYPLFSAGKYEVALKLPYLRESFQKNGKKVTDIIAETLPNTFILALVSILLATFLGILLGIISALNKDTFIDKTIQLVSTFAMSLPSFFSAIILAWLFGFLWHNFTGLSMTGNLFEWDDYGIAYQLKIKNMILPALALGIRPLAVVVQLMRNSLLEVLSSDYIRTAYAKGLSTQQVILRHALRNALNPVITALSGWFAGMLAGAVFVEYVFGWNGLGKQIVDAINTLDLPVIMGSVLVISTCFIIINILVDITYSWLDPRIRNEK